MFMTKLLNCYVHFFQLSNLNGRRSENTYNINIFHRWVMQCTAPPPPPLWVWEGQGKGWGGGERGWGEAGKGGEGGGLRGAGEGGEGGGLRGAGEGGGLRGGDCAHPSF